MKRILCLSMTVLVISVFSVQAQQVIKLYEGTVVRIRLNESLDSRISKIGDMVNLESADEVTVDGIVVIKKGAPAKGVISVVSPAGLMGKKGQLDFTIDYVTAVNGENVRLRFLSSSAGKSRIGGAVAGALVLSPLFLLVKGKNITVEKDKEFTVYVDKDYEFTSKDLNIEKQKEK